MGCDCIARLGLSRQDLNDQSTLKSLISDVRFICEGVTPITSNTGEAGIENSLGVSLVGLVPAS